MQPPSLQHLAIPKPKTWADSVTPLVPGLFLAALLALLSVLLAARTETLLAERLLLPVSPIVIAILLGAALRNITGLDQRVQPGLNFSQCKILQVGVVLLGIRLSLGDLALTGFGALPLIAACITTALLLIFVLGKLLRLSPQLAVLIAAGTSICGATAIATVAPLLQAKSHETAYAIACITLFGIIATLAYPLGAHWLFDGDEQQIGLFLGTAIHDTAQVVGAGLIYQNLFGSELALDVATVTKLARNLAMLLVIPALAITFRRQQPAIGKTPHWYKLVPLFVVGFVAMCVVRTTGDYLATAYNWYPVAEWDTSIELIKSAAAGALLIAMAALGLNIRLAELKQIGLRPLALAFAAASLVGVLSGTLIYSFY